MLRNTGFVMRLRDHPCAARQELSRFEWSGNPPADIAKPTFTRPPKAFIFLQLKQSVARHIQILDEDLP
jgi:hypothetical protein